MKDEAGGLLVLERKEGNNKRNFFRSASPIVRSFAECGDREAMSAPFGKKLTAASVVRTAKAARGGAGEKRKSRLVKAEKARRETVEAEKR
jgi:hypothetical protein